MASPAKFSFVLYRPQSAGNIGAVARALKNMGFDDLRLVGRGPLNDREAVKMAVHADDVLANATVYSSLADALADCSLAVGTTSRRGGYRSRATPLRAAAAELDALAETNKIAIVFGREDRGLTNRELLAAAPRDWSDAAARRLRWTILFRPRNGFRRNIRSRGTRSRSQSR